MTTVAILPVSDANGERLYRAIAFGTLCDRYRHSLVLYPNPLALLA